MAAGPKEKGAFPDEQGSSWPLNQVFSGFTPSRIPHRSLSARRRAGAVLAGARDLRGSGRHCQEAAQVSEAVKSGASAGSASAGISAEAIRQLAPPRQRKLQIACFRLAAKMRSLRCASSPHKISDFAGAPNAQLSGWRSPAISRGFLGGEILRTVRRPKTPGAPAGAQHSGSGGERRRSETSEISRLRGNERCGTCVDEVRQFHPLSVFLPTFPTWEK